MVNDRRVGRRRLAAVASGVVGLTALAGSFLAIPAFAAPSAAQAAQQAPLVAGTPCTTTAKACVDLDSQRAWLLKDGKFFRGPVKISSGGNGKETPIGHSLRVYRKEKDWKSKESRLPNGQPAPMPWSVFFEDGGIAFHSGSPNRSSAGCIHLNPADAQAWFNFLQVGDQVQVVRASQEIPKHRKDVAAKAAPAPAAQSADQGSDSENSDDEDDDSGDDDSGDDSGG